MRPKHRPPQNYYSDDLLRTFRKAQKNRKNDLPLHPIPHNSTKYCEAYHDGYDNPDA